ncbi:FYVE, RhoGEF and PH domain-containing protein 6-like isoform X2 [Salarias fasciatus]|uniref:FYVE, RhoGEF and PH domain-containing protein 6-like isoform X2 n=1 Tax=Salarias fasciatus TaxID=181472 RepID=UPI0011765725|nr:FYVE, RhoGEF and PH domain-containing protein 6-like isoform X2 [Salarias fasciatus]
MMNSGTPKPPLAPKPKLTQHQRAGLSPKIPRRDGTPLLSPGSPRRAKPVLAPKPCLSKLSTAVESKPRIPKSPHQISVPDPPRTVGLLNSQNGLQQENKKPDWDYVIPICLCSQENCMCIRTSPANAKHLEKDLKPVHNGKAKENENGLQASRGIFDNHKDQTDSKTHQVKNTSSSSTLLALQADRTLHTVAGRFCPGVTVELSSPHRTWSDEANGNTLPQSVTGRGPEEDALGSEQTGVPQPRLVPAAPRKPVPVPVPRKPRPAALARQEKVEREEIVSLEGMKTSVTEVKVSSEGKCSSVSVPANESEPNICLSARKAYVPPAPPPRKKPLLSKPETAAAPAPQTPPKDVMEEDLGWDSSGSFGMEVSVDEEDVPNKETDDRRATDGHLAHRPASSGSLAEHPAIAAAAAEEGKAKVVPKKPQRNSSPMALFQKRESHEEDDVGETGVYEEHLVRPSHDGVLQKRVLRELPLPPKEKPSKNLLSGGIVKPSRSSLNKQKARSFSAADLIVSEGQRRNSFRKLLDLKLSVPKMLPKLMAKGSQSPDSSVTDNGHTVFKDQDDGQKYPESFRPSRKLSCPLIGVEQSVDGDEFPLGVEQTGYYENVPYYEEIPDYVNEHIYEATSPSQASSLQPGTGQNPLYSDEGIYEEQEPYISLVKPTDDHERQTQTDNDKSSVAEEAAVVNEAHSDDDIAADSSDEEDEDDSSSLSSKGDPEQPGESSKQSDKKKSKIHHIATEIMSSESVFVDALKLLHVDFRDSVSQASRQSGKPVIEERHLNQILYYLPQLYELNQDLLRELKQRVATWDEHARLADVFLKKGPYLKMYSTYIREYDKNVALLEEQTKRSPAFGAVVRTFEASPRCASLALKHYLLKPVQRIPQYQLLLTDYLKNLSEDSCDYKDTQAALAIVKEVANHANDIMKQGDNFQKLIQVQCRLNGHHEIVQPGRIFLKEGILKKLARKVMQPRMFFLFNDTLLYTTPVQSGQFKLNNMLSLAGMKVSKPSQEAYQNELNIESVERSFILSASSAAERDEWLEAISTAIGEYTKKKISFISGKPLHEGGLGDGGDGSPLGSKAPIWIPDPRTTMCMICTCEFTLTWRRHHCRACGKVVCQACSSNKHCLEYLKKQPARVCDQCFAALQQQRSESPSSAALSPGSKATFAFPRRQKKIPAALKEVSANTYDSSMSGYLQRSKGTKRQGKRLWFVIKDKVLYTYAASEDVAALESQPLLGFMLKFDPSQKLQFKLYHKNTLYYIFKADDMQTAQRWIDSFKEATVL